MPPHNALAASLQPLDLRSKPLPSQGPPSRAWLSLAEPPPCPWRAFPLHLMHPANYYDHYYYYYTSVLPRGKVHPADKVHLKAAKYYPSMDSPEPSKTQSTVGTVLSIYTAPCQPGPNTPQISLIKQNCMLWRGSLHKCMADMDRK